MDTETTIQNINRKAAKWDAKAIENEVFTTEEQALLQKYKPENVFIIYGTLAPGRPNHHHVAHINGRWEKGVVRGQLVQEGWGAALGYNGFLPAVADKQEVIEAHILFSEEMPANWAFLDDFEGEGYTRILAQYELDNGAIGVGCIYAIKQKDK